MAKQFFKANRTIFLTAAALAALMFLLRWLELRFLIVSHAIEIYVGAIALIFTGLGIWLALRLTKPKTVIVEKEVYISGKPFVLNETVLEQLGLSRRELEVLELMSAGLSNQEIANRLFVSLNTVKTHTSKLFEKLEVKRRTQAVEKAKRIGLIP
jgi:two-component system, NarL family, response regulator LiaR